MILGIQVIGVLFALFMLYYCFLHYKRNEFKFGEFAAWLLLWLFFGLLSVYPSILDPFLKPIDVARRMDLLTITGLMFVFAMTMYTHFLTRRMEKKIEDVVRKVAFDNPENDKKAAKPGK